ncbi:MAG TPA: hypothetical protein VF407_22035, partial [Polyangiaceae bacterium]
LLIVPLVVGCGGASANSVTARTSTELTTDQIDADPIALLPGSPVALANVDAKGFFASQNFGSALGKLAEQYVPVGDQAGFVASRDVDRVVAASYSTQGIDVVAVLSGRFDQKKIADAATNKTPMRDGNLLVVSTYSNRTIYTIDNVGFTILTDHTAVLGTETGMHRLLDRIHDGKKDRAVTGWMLDTIQTKDAAFAVAVDLATQSISNTVTAQLPVQFLKGVKAVRGVGAFKDSSTTELAGSITYDTDDNASAGAAGLKTLVTMANAASIFGIVPRLDNVDVHTEKTSLQYQLDVDDSALKKLLNQIPPPSK